MTLASAFLGTIQAAQYGHTYGICTFSTPTAQTKLIESGGGQGDSYGDTVREV